jgi:hypothetical protein
MSSPAKEYIVKWTIDIAAQSPREAVERARDIQRSAESTALVFEVIGPEGDCEEIDLMDELAD